MEIVWIGLSLICFFFFYIKSKKKIINNKNLDSDKFEASYYDSSNSFIKSLTLVKFASGLTVRNLFDFNGYPYDI